MRFFWGILLMVSSVSYGETLSQIIQGAMERSPIVTKAIAYIKEDAAGVDAARAAFLPQIDGYVSVGREKNGYFPLAIGLSPSAFLLNPNGAGLQGTMNLFNGFSDYYSYLASKATLNAQEKNFIAVQNQVIYQVVSDVYNLLIARQLIAQSKKNLEIARTSYELMKKRFQAGLNTRSDLGLAEGRYKLVQSENITFINRLAQAEAQYLQDIGVAPPDVITVPPVPYHKIPKKFNTLQVKAFAHNPDLSSAALQLRAAKLGVLGADGPFMPNVELLIMDERTKNQYGLPMQRNHWQAALTMNWNLFNGGSDLAAKKQAIAAQKVAYTNYDSTTLDLLNQLQSTWSVYQYATQQIIDLRRYVDDLNLVYHDYGDQFLVGRREVMLYLNAEREYYTSETMYIQQKYQFELSAYKIFSLMGNLPEIATHLENQKRKASMKK